MGEPRTSNARREPIVLGVSLSGFAHVCALVALAGVTAQYVPVRTAFRGKQQTVQLTATFSEPRWSERAQSIVPTLEDLPVVIEPREARIARQRFVQESAADLAVLRVQDETEWLAANRPLLGPTAQPSPSQEPDVTPDLPQRRRRTPSPRPPDVTQASMPASDLGAEEQPTFTDSPPPEYPSLAVTREWEGTVILRVHITAEGNVENVEVARSSGHRILDGAAVRAVQRWKGTPARRRGMPVATVELLPISFQLRAD